MFFEILGLGVAGKVINDVAKIEYLKSKQIELSRAEKKAFSEDESRRFIHFTSRECAEKIMQSGFLIPTKGMIDNHFTRSIDSKGKSRISQMVYMFDNKTFSVDDYIRNLPKKRSPFNGCYEYYAVSTKPDAHEIENFRKRAYDGAVTYEGRLDVDGTDTRLVKYALVLNENGEYDFQEMPFNAEYIPSQELLAKLEKDRMGTLSYTLKIYLSEINKARHSLKRFKVEEPEYKEQIRRKKEFAKANRQFAEEEKDKSYVYEQDGRTIVVKNIEYQELGGKKLQKVAIIEPDKSSKGRKAKDIVSFCYMDELDLSKLEPEIASKYFFNNHDEIRQSKSKTPKYVGMPLLNLETGEVLNEYDTTYDRTFKEYMDKRQIRTDRLDKKYEEMKKGKGIISRIKTIFSRAFGRKPDAKMLPEGREQRYDIEDREKLAQLGYSSVETMNKDDKEASMYSLLKVSTMSPEDITDYDISEEGRVNAKGREDKCL